jgi:hypothetical protein
MSKPKLTANTTKKKPLALAERVENGIQNMIRVGIADSSKSQHVGFEKKVIESAPYQFRGTLFRSDDDGGHIFRRAVATVDKMDSANHSVASIVSFQPSSDAAGGWWLVNDISSALRVKRTGQVCIVDARARAEAVGAKPGEPLKDAAAKAVLKRIAEGTTDIFSSVDKAESYLKSPNFAGSGKDAFHLIKAGGTATVLGRLDELRFGSQG